MTLYGFACVDGHLDGRGTITVDEVIDHGEMSAGRREGAWQFLSHDEYEGVIHQYGNSAYSDGLRHGHMVTVAASEDGPQIVAGRFAAGIPAGR